jgi:hypothetical protein
LIQDRDRSISGTLASGDTAFYELTVSTDPNAPSSTTVTVMAQVTSDTNDPDISSNTTSIDTMLI